MKYQMQSVAYIERQRYMRLILAWYLMLKRVPIGVMCLLIKEYFFGIHRVMWPAERVDCFLGTQYELFLFD